MIPDSVLTHQVIRERKGAKTADAFGTFTDAWTDTQALTVRIERKSSAPQFGRKGGGRVDDSTHVCLMNPTQYAEGSVITNGGATLPDPFRSTSTPTDVRRGDRLRVVSATLPDLPAGSLLRVDDVYDCDGDHREAALTFTALDAASPSQGEQ